VQSTALQLSFDKSKNNSSLLHQTFFKEGEAVGALAPPPPPTPPLLRTHTLTRTRIRCTHTRTSSRPHAHAYTRVRIRAQAVLYFYSYSLRLRLLVLIPPAYAPAHVREWLPSKKAIFCCQRGLRSFEPKGEKERCITKIKATSRCFTCAS